MNSRLCAYFGNPWVGMFVKTNNEKTFVPIDANEKLIKIISDNLGTEVIPLSMGDSNLLGVYIAMNSNGVVLPNIATSAEIAIVKKTGINVYVSNERNNAHGNNIAVNDNSAIINEATSAPWPIIFSLFISCPIIIFNIWIFTIITISI